MTQDTVEFIIDSRDIVLAVDEYKLSVTREFRTMRSLGLIHYEPIASLSPMYKFECRKKKTTYLNLKQMFEDALLKVKTKEKVDSESYKIREMLNNHAKTI